MRYPHPHRFWILALGLAVLLVACGPGLPGITVTDPFARSSPTAGGTGGAFMTITNNGAAPDRLVAAESPAARVVELHETINEDGVMKMRPQPDGFPIEGKGKLLLQPGGKHIMLIDLVEPLVAGSEIQITLKFEKAGPLTVRVPVREP